MTTSDHDVQQILIALLEISGDLTDFTDTASDDNETPLDIDTVSTFDDAGVLTLNKGIVLTLSDRSQFQITIVRSA